MSFSQRVMGIFLLIALSIAPQTLFAQSDTDASVISGSAIAAPVLQSLLPEDFSTTLEINGTDAGFSAFCNGETSIVTSTRVMSVEEEQNCNANAVTFAEVLLAYDAVAFIAHPDLSDLSCISSLELSGTLAPSSSQNTTWESIVATMTDAAPVSIFLPASNTSTFALTDAAVAGVGFRSDATQLDDAQAIIEAVASTAGAFGVVPFGTLADAEAVITVQLRNEQLASCITPSSATLGDGSYPLSTPLLAYVNLATLAESDALQAAFEAVGAGNAEAVRAAGFTPIAESDAVNNQESLMAENGGRQFSQDLTAYQLPPTLTGNINIGGAAGAFSLVSGIQTSFNAQYDTVTLNVSLIGEPAGLRSLCNSEVDMAITYSTLDEETLTNCTAAEISPLTLSMGSQATVLVANADADYLACLTTEQIGTTWGAQSEGVTNWQDIDASFADQEFFLFAGALGNPIPNLMMQRATGENLPIRTDVQTNNDPLYRAAATANVDGGLTYMSWAQYQQVLENNQQGVQLVAVDGGDGCVTPSDESINSGEYPLSRATYLAVSNVALERSEVQAFLWYMFQSERFENYRRANFDTLTLNALEDNRATLQANYELANAAAIERANAAAAEAATETEAEATEEAEATPAS